MDESLGKHGYGSPVLYWMKATLLNAAIFHPALMQLALLSLAGRQNNRMKVSCCFSYGRI